MLHNLHLTRRLGTVFLISCWIGLSTCTDAFLVPRDILQTALLLNDENVHIRQRTHLLPQVAMTESQANDFQKKKICHPNKRPLFSFLLADGSEIHGLLPSVQRRLDLGIPCYFEPNDLAVQQVLESLDYDDDSKQQQQQQQQQHGIWMFVGHWKHVRVMFNKRRSVSDWRNIITTFFIVKRTTQTVPVVCPSSECFVDTGKNNDTERNI
jgi:hypothetical protein